MMAGRSSHGVARQHETAGSPVLSLQASIAVRSRVRIPLAEYSVEGEFVSFTGFGRQAEHFAIVFAGTSAQRPPLVRMHSECITGDLFGSLRCDCGPQLRQSMDWLAREGGVLLYLRQEGRGIGLFAKLDAYLLQEQGLDTYAANEALELPRDGREFHCGAQMLHALGVSSIRLISNNPDKARHLQDSGITVAEVLLTDTFSSDHNKAYLQAKLKYSGHSLTING